jgi:hypothetical protein
MATMEELYQQYLLTQPGIGGSQNRYRELMSQMRPFANPYPAATGLLAGGTATPAVPKVPTKTNPMGTYGGGGPGLSAGAGMTNSTWDSMTDAQKASYYADNPTMAGITQFGQSLFGNTSLGKLQGLFAPGFVADQGLIAMGVDPQAYQAAKETFRQSEINAMNRAAEAEAAAAAQAAAQAQAEQDTAAANVSSPTAVSMTSMQDALNRDEAAAIAAREAARASFVPGLLAQFAAQIEAQQAANSAAQAAQTSYESGIGNPGESIGFTSSESGIGNPGEFSYTSSESGIGNPGESYGGGYDSGGYGTGDSSGFGGGTDSGSDGWAKGGKVTKDRLKGPDPKGPDEGYGALLGGEFVIQKSAVKKYGEGLLSMINDGKIPAKKMKSLLG